MARTSGGATRFLKRLAAVAAGVVLGVAITAGASAWQSRSARALRVDIRPAPPLPVRRERAPDPRG